MILVRKKSVILLLIRFVALFASHPKFTIFFSNVWSCWQFILTNTRWKWMKCVLLWWCFYKSFIFTNFNSSFSLTNFVMDHRMSMHECGNLITSHNRNSMFLLSKFYFTKCTTSCGKRNFLPASRDYWTFARELFSLSIVELWINKICLNW
jgi:hypothetical protein